MKDIIIVLIIGLIVFELIEHVVLPLFWTFKHRKQGAICGAEGMFGKVVEVRQWSETEGQVAVDGELWRGVSDVPLSTGGKAIIQDVAGLTLRLKPFND